MTFLDVVPLVHLPRPFPQILTYASRITLPSGALVRVPLRHRSVLAIVITSSKKAKTAGKQSFRIRPIDEVILTHSLLPQSLLELAWWLAEYYMSSKGLVLRAMLPSYIFSRKGQEYVKNLPRLFEKRSRRQNKPPKPILALGDTRMNLYKKILRDTIQKGQQVLVLVPERAVADSLIDAIVPKDMEPVVLSSDQSSLQFFQQWQKIRTGDAPLVIGTRIAAFAPVSKLGCIILDQEGSSAHKSEEQHPRYHARELAKKLSSLTGAGLIFGDTTPSAESFHASQKKFVALRGNIPSTQRPRGVIVDMRTDLERQFSQARRFKPLSLSKEVLRAMEKTLGTGGRAILFVNRKGIATAVLCRDCGFILQCSRCEAPLVVYRETKTPKRVLRCHHCGRETKSSQTCPACRSWRFHETGIAGQRVEEELRSLFPDRGIVFRLDRSSSPTPKIQKETLKLFSETPGSVLITTQMLFGKTLSVKADLGVVVSADQLFYRPDFRSSERAFRMIMQLRTFLGSYAKFFLQSYGGENPLLTLIAKGDAKSFLNRELKERRRYGYPPFKKLVKISFAHQKNDSAQKNAEDLAEKLQSISGIKILGPVPAFIPKVRGKYIWHILLKFSDANAAKTKQGLLDIIPSTWNIDVDPESIL